MNIDNSYLAAETSWDVAVLTVFMLGNFLCFYCRLLTFCVKINLKFSKHISGIFRVRLKLYEL